jgi:hypothetical protein
MAAVGYIRYDDKEDEKRTEAAEDEWRKANT